MREHRENGERPQPADLATGTARARVLLVLSILKGETSVAEVARRQKVPTTTVEHWKKLFLAGAENALRPSPRVKNPSRESDVH